MAARRASTCPKCGKIFTSGVAMCPSDASDLVEMTADHDPLVGTIVDDTYVVLERLGQGGMGVVYKALQFRLHRPVALKVLAPQFGGDTTAGERFETEARAISQLSNPHTVTVHDFGATEDGVLYIAMQLLDGETLRARMQRERIPLSSTLSIVSDVCESLAEAHERRPQIIHRDIKPDNIFVRETDTGDVVATVLDFGLARFADSQRLTAQNATVGTVTYMAPEQARGEEGVDARTDLYSLGVMLFELVAGSPPFNSADKMSVLYKHVYEEAPRLRVARPHMDIPESLDLLVAELLEKAPDRRPASARLVRLRLGEIQKELTSPARAARAAVVESTPDETHTVATRRLTMSGVEARTRELALGINSEEVSTKTSGKLAAVTQEPVSAAAADTLDSPELNRLNATRRGRARLVVGAGVALLCFGAGIGIVIFKYHPLPPATVKLVARTAPAPALRVESKPSGPTPHVEAQPASPPAPPGSPDGGDLPTVTTASSPHPVRRRVAKKAEKKSSPPSIDDQLNAIIDE